MLLFELFPALLLVVSLVVGVRLFIVNRHAPDDALELGPPREAADSKDDDSSA